MGNIDSINKSRLKFLNFIEQGSPLFDKGFITYKELVTAIPEFENYKLESFKDIIGILGYIVLFCKRHQLVVDVRLSGRQKYRHEIVQEVIEAVEAYEQKLGVKKYYKQEIIFNVFNKRITKTITYTSDELSKPVTYEEVLKIYRTTLKHYTKTEKDTIIKFLNEGKYLDIFLDGFTEEYLYGKPYFYSEDPANPLYTDRAFTRGRVLEKELK